MGRAIVMRVGAALVVLVILGPLAAVAMPAEAAPPAVTTTVCVDYAIKQDVMGDLRVPDHHRCFLKKIEVHGTIHVGRFATVDLERVTADGDIDAAARSNIGVSINSHVAGSVHLTHAGVVDVGFSTVDGDIDGTLWTSADTAAAAILIGNATVGGNVRVAAPLESDGTYSFAIDGASIGGNVRLSRMQDNSSGPIQVGGSLILDALQPYVFTENAAQVCGMNVAGNATLQNTSTSVQWGGRSCSPNAIAGALLVHDNTGLVRLAGTVGGNLACRRNLHHPRLLRFGTPAVPLQVTAHEIGQCTALT